MTPAIQSLREKLQPIFDEIHARYDFEAQATVTMTGVDPARTEFQWRIDRASRWCEFAEHHGRIRRHVDAHLARVIWAFEHADDAEDFESLFGGSLRTMLGA